MAIEAIKMIPMIVIGLVVAGIVLAAGLKSIGSFKSTMTSDSVEYNSTVKTIGGINEISNQMSTIGIIAAMVVILMLIGGIAVYFGMR